MQPVLPRLFVYATCAASSAFGIKCRKKMRDNITYFSTLFSYSVEKCRYIKDFNKEIIAYLGIIDYTWLIFLTIMANSSKGGDAKLRV